MSLTNNTQPLFIATDHAGFKLKEDLKQKFADVGIEITDLTPVTPDPKDDYPKVAKKLTTEVISKDGQGILLCGSGNGICMAANKIKGIRAALGYNTQSAIWAKNDENANVLCLAGQVLNPDYAFSIVKHWLETPFSKEPRHQKRIKELAQLDK